MGDWNRLEDLFGEAVALPTAERASFVARHCGDDVALRRELESLLVAHDTTDGVLDRSPLEGDALVDNGGDAGERPRALEPGVLLGPWRLGAWIGRGGTGDVYVAERADGAFDQRVAIKVLRHEAAAEAARFHAERHLLAQFEHPGIARLLDGGMTADVRPYAVLEFVEGRTMTEHARGAGFGLEARLRLFGQVCDAVSYAHRHLVVHRDLKPANIVVNADGHVKLLDFGIAKLLAADTEAAATQAPLTLDYAAPEQLLGGPVTTATDVYSLGVVLFELLTGNRPWRSGDLPVARAVRMVLDEPAPRASASVDRATAALVPARGLEGDLDAIVARCLRKPPAERYPTVEALWQDVERYLRREPVAAREGAALYRVGRFVERHRWPVAASAALVLSLAGGLGAFAWQAERAERERDIARRAASREEAVRSQLIRLFRASLEESKAKPGDTPPVSAKAMLDRSAERVIEQYRDDPALAGTLVETLSDLYGALGDLEGQRPLLEGFLTASGVDGEARAVALARQKLANLELMRGNPKRAAELLPLAEAVWNAAPESYREERLEGLMMRGQLERAQGDLESSITTFRSAIEQRLAVSGRVHRETANLYNSLAISLTAANRAEEALTAHREALAIHQDLGLGEDLDALVILGNTGTLAFRSGRVREAEEILATAYRKQRALAGDSAAVAAAMGLHGAALRIRGKAGDALPILDEALAMAVKFTGPASPLAVQNRLFRAEALSANGAVPAARRALRENFDIARAQYGETHVLALRMRLALARLELTANAPRAAADQVRELLPQLEALKGPSAAFQAHARVVLGDALLRLGEPGLAIEPLRAAVSQRESMLWSGSWELAEARARLGEALLRTGDPAGGALLQAAVEALSAELGPDHAEARRAAAALAAPAALAAAS
jgi:tetratricopeptide (TPR) repeat protein